MRIHTLITIDFIDFLDGINDINVINGEYIFIHTHKEVYVMTQTNNKILEELESINDDHFSQFILRMILSFRRKWGL